MDTNSKFKFLALKLYSVFNDFYSTVYSVKIKIQNFQATGIIH